MKGQSAVELTMVIGMAMILASPFIVSSQSSVVDMRATSEFLNLDTSMESLKMASNEVQESSYPARRTIEFRTPESVVKVYNRQFENSSALVMEARYRGRLTNHSTVFGYSLNVKDQSDLSEEGIHEVSVRKNIGPGVNVSVIS